MKIACLGDSITYYGGPGAYRPVVQLLQLALDQAYGIGVHFVGNHGVHSDLVTAGMTTRYPLNIVGKGYDALVFLGGINDIDSDVSAASILSAAEAILDDARTTQAMRVVMITMSPFAGYTAWTTTRQTVWETVNSGYRSYASAHSLQLVDAATLLSDGATPPALASGYAYTDGLHWSQSACDLIAPLVQTALGL